MEFTKEEISLCRQVAERHRKDIKYGDWFYWEYGGTQPVLCNDGGLVHYKRYKNKKKSFPLWTISDCLEWLMTKGTDCAVFYDPEDEIWKGYLTIIDQNCIAEKGKTPLEACLKAVLAVLEEETK